MSKNEKLIGTRDILELIEEMMRVFSDKPPDTIGYKWEGNTLIIKIEYDYLISGVVKSEMSKM